MTSIEEVKRQIINLYWNNELSVEENKLRKSNIENIINNKNTTERYKHFEHLMSDIQNVLGLKTLNTSVTYFPSYSFQVALQIERYKDYTIISEFHFYISSVCKTYTGYFVKYMIDHIKISTKEKKTVLKPLILTTPPDLFIERYNLIKKVIANKYKNYQHFPLNEFFINMPVENITYTVNKIQLFHLVFADFKIADYKIV